MTRSIPQGQEGTHRLSHSEEPHVLSAHRDRAWRVGEMTRETLGDQKDSATQTILVS